MIALLIVLGVNLIVIVMVAASVLGRKRYLKRQPGEFAGAIRVSNGDLDGLSSKWKHGFGRWVRDVLIWNKAPFLFRTDLVPVDSLSGERPEHADDVKRLGKTPVVIEFTSTDAKVEVAARAEHRPLVAGPVTAPAAVAREG